MDYIFKRKNDPKMYIVPSDDKVVRRYFKTVNVPDEIIPYVQPVLSSNGVYGEGDLSVKAVNNYGTGEISPLYGAFDSNSGNYWEGRPPCEIYIYSKKSIKVSSILFTIAKGYPPSSITAYGSNEGSQWTEIASANPAHVYNEDTTFNINSSAFYHHYWIHVESAYTWSVSKITINAEEIIKEAYSYEIEVAEGEEYDRMEETKSLSRLGVKRK